MFARTACFALILPWLLGAQITLTTITLTTTPNPSVFGAPVTLTATVTPSNATGKVSFYDGTDLLGSTSISSGIASLATIFLPAGSRKLKANYSGDSVYPAKTSSLITQNVIAAPGGGFIVGGHSPTFLDAVTPVLGDFNGDGNVDVAVNVPPFPTNMQILLGDGHGSWLTGASYARASAVAVGDFNQDGKMDILTWNAYTMGLLLGMGDGTFHAQGVPNLSSVGDPLNGNFVVGDWNADGKLDFAIAASKTIQVVLGNGDGTFQAVREYGLPHNCESLTVGDFNGDGKVDFLVGQSDDLGGYTLLMLTGAGDGTFQPGPNIPSMFSRRVVADDFNRDGKLDLGLFSVDGLAVFLGNGDGSFQTPLVTPFPYPYPAESAFGDFDGDGKVDLVIFGGSDGEMTLLTGQGDGNFQAGTRFQFGLAGYTSPPNFTFLAFSPFTADLNGDGKADIVLTAIKHVYLPGISSSSSSTIYSLLGAQLYAVLKTTGGSAQSATLGTQFPAPLQVNLVTNGSPVSGATVTFSRPTSGASAVLSASTAVTDASGTASVIATANLLPGTYTVQATYQNQVVSFALNNLGAPTSLVASGGTPQSVGLGAAFPVALQVTVNNPAGNPVSGATVTFTPPSSGAGALLSSPTAVTNASGVASVTAIANDIAGAYTVKAAIGSLETSFSLTNVASGSFNLALRKTATQSSTYPWISSSPATSAGAATAVDGDTGSSSYAAFSSTDLENNAWWQVDLGTSALIDAVAIWNRIDCCSTRLNDYWVFISDTPFGASDTPATLQNRASTWSSHQTTVPSPSITIPAGHVQGRYVRVQLTGLNYLSLAEVQVFGIGGIMSPANLAAGKPAAQSSTYPGYPSAAAAAATDAKTDGAFYNGSVTATNQETSPWWQVDLGSSANVTSVVIWNRTDCCASRLNDYWVFVSDTPFTATDTPFTLQNRAGTFANHQMIAPSPSTAIVVNAQGRYVRVQLTGTNYLSLAEVQVFGTGGAPAPANVAQGKTATQSSTLPGYPSAAASSAVDGNSNGNFFANSVTATNQETSPWWQVDLGASRPVNSVVIWNRTDCCGPRLGDYWLFVSDLPFAATDTPATVQNRANTFAIHQTSAPSPSIAIPVNAPGRYVRVQLSGTDYLSLAEVQVFGQ